MSATITFRVDEDIKEQATALSKKLGMDLSTALNLFLVKYVSENGLPFMVKAEPNVEDMKKYGIPVIESKEDLEKLSKELEELDSTKSGRPASIVLGELRRKYGV